MIEDQAGIKFKHIGAPQPEDVVKASARGVLKKIEDVSDDVLELFTESAMVRYLITYKCIDCDRSLRRQ